MRRGADRSRSRPGPRIETNNRCAAGEAFPSTQPLRLHRRDPGAAGFDDPGLGQLVDDRRDQHRLQPHGRIPASDQQNNPRDCIPRDCIAHHAGGRDQDHQEGRQQRYAGLGDTHTHAATAHLAGRRSGRAKAELPLQRQATTCSAMRPDAHAEMRITPWHVLSVITALR